MRHMLRRGGVVTSAVTGLMVLSTASALAHVCTNASRSAQGNQAAGTNSQAWIHLTIEQITEWDVADGFYGADAVPCIIEEWYEGGAGTLSVGRSHTDTWAGWSAREVAWRISEDTRTWSTSSRSR